MRRVSRRKRRKHIFRNCFKILLVVFLFIVGMRIIPQLMREYPEEVVELYKQNKETRSFVLNYPRKKGKVYGDTIDSVENGKIPHLLQWDQRWGYGNYGNSMLAISGCGPTCLAMVIAGVTGSNEVTPYEVAQFAEERGYYVEDVGTSWSLFTDGIQQFGVTGKQIALTKKAVMQSLEAGHPIICSMRPGDFTTSGHFIVLAGVQDGKIKVNDPNSKSRSEKLWDYETLEFQIKQLWTFS